MTYLYVGDIPVGARVKSLRNWHGREGVVIAPEYDVDYDGRSKLWIDLEGYGPMHSWDKDDIEVISLPAEDETIFKYEVKAGNFARTYDDEGKAIAVARAVRDYAIAVEDNPREVSLTKTPVKPVSVKVAF